MASPSPTTTALLGDGRSASFGSAVYASNEPRNGRMDSIINSQAQGAQQQLPGITPAGFEPSLPLSIDPNFGFISSPQESTTSNNGIDAPPELRRAQGQTSSTLNSVAAATMVNMSPQQPSQGSSFARLDSAFEREMLNHPGRANSNSWTPSTSAGRPPSSPDESSRASGVNDGKPSTNNTNSRKKEGLDGDKRPAWSELKTKAGKERKRLPLACIVCRRKKIRCSGEKPACKHCLRARVPCVYKVTTRKAAPRTDYMAMLDKRLKRMEDRVIKAIPKEELPDLSLTGPKYGLLGKKRSAHEAFTKELNEWGSPGQRGPEGEENKLFTEGVESLPSQQMQEHLVEVFFDCVYGQSYLLLHKPSFMRKLKAGTVPPVLILAMCAISARFSTHPQVSTEPAFLRGEQWATPARRIVERRHYEPNITILIAMLLLGLHYFGTCEGGLSWSFGGQAMRMGYALQLHRELDHDPLGRNELLGDKGSAVAAPGTGVTNNAATTTSNETDNSASNNSSGDKTETRPNQAPGKNKAELSFTDREIRRRAMWALYLMDTFNSSGTERPSFLNEEYMQIQLPIKEENFLMDVSGPTEDLEGNISPSLARTFRYEVTDPGAATAGGATVGPNMATLGADEMRLAATAKSNMGVAAYIIRAVVVWKRIVKYLNLGGKERDPLAIWNPSSQFASLQLSISKLKSALPDHLTYTQKNLDTHASLRLANQFLFLHIVIAQTSLFLHRFAIPSSPHPHTHSYTRQFLYSDMPHSFLASSATTVLKSAEEITKLIGASAGHTLTVPFAGYCAYASATVHVWGIFSRNTELAASSKEALSTNFQYLTRMKRYWGMFYYMAESVKEAYRRFANAAMRQGGAGPRPPLSHKKASSEAGETDGSGRRGSEASSIVDADAESGAPGATASEESKGNGRQMFQYGDWFDKYPHGVSESDWESSHLEYRKEGGPGTQAVMSQQSDLLSVEEFFATLSRTRAQEEEHAAGGGAAQDKNKKGKTTRKRRKSTVDTATDKPSVSSAPRLAGQETMSSLAVRGGLSSTHPDPNQPSIDLTPFPNEFDLASPSLDEFQIPQSLASDPFFDSLVAGTGGTARGAMQYSYAAGLPHLDRQMVFGAYADIDSSTMMSHRMLGNTWMIPFNIDPSNFIMTPGSGEDAIVGPDEDGASDFGSGGL
ncbi:hypothetical protein DV738_g667, partial [Chaetothyriales sp. CBS 135597]